ncbi:MAG: thioredoxin-dependent thiol peroxidase [Muribaculaceae bacterium]|nr:thioredoxin-dependent thiol peroxidase [Muribaculaceae bacterium]
MNPGDKMPDLLGLDAEGREVRISDYPGKKIALYFYPKDSTPGCTAQACSLRDNYQALLDAGYQVIGCSVDGPAAHRRFAEKNALPFPLISDADHHLVELAGVWGEKTLAGRKYFGTLRTTFILSPDGTVEQVITPKQIKTKIHAEQILAL